MSWSIDIISCITDRFVELTATEKRIAQFILDDVAAAAELPIAEMARLTHTSQASVTRFARALGCKDVRELEASPSIQTILLGGIVKKGYHCVVAINGRSILDTLNVDKAFMGANSLSLKHGACVADIMLAETKRGMVEHASQVIIVCDYRSEEHTSELQSPAMISYAVFCLKKKK